MSALEEIKEDNISCKISLSDCESQKGALRKESIPTKPRSRSVPDVAVLNSQPHFPAELLIKYQRLLRGFFWNTFFPSLVCWLFYFLKSDTITYEILGRRYAEIILEKVNIYIAFRVPQLSKNFMKERRCS